MRIGSVVLALAVLGCGAPGDELVGEWSAVTECTVDVGGVVHAEPAYASPVIVSRDAYGELVLTLELGGETCAVVLEDGQIRPGSSTCAGAVPWVVTRGTAWLSVGELAVEFSASYVTGPARDVVVTASCFLEAQRL